MHMATATATARATLSEAHPSTGRLCLFLFAPHLDPCPPIAILFVYRQQELHIGDSKLGYSYRQTYRRDQDVQEEKEKKKDVFGKEKKETRKTNLSRSIAHTESRLKRPKACPESDADITHKRARATRTPHITLQGGSRTGPIGRGCSSSSSGGGGSRRSSSTSSGCGTASTKEAASHRGRCRSH
jgi:hypothetical protein